MAPHPNTPAWKIPWTEEPGRLQSMGCWEQLQAPNSAGEEVNLLEYSAHASDLFTGNQLKRDIGPHSWLLKLWG